MFANHNLNEGRWKKILSLQEGIWWFWLRSRDQGLIEVSERGAGWGCRTQAGLQGMKAPCLVEWKVLWTRESGGEGGVARRGHLECCPEVFTGEGNQKRLWTWDGVGIVFWLSSHIYTGTVLCPVSSCLQLRWFSNDLKWHSKPHLEPQFCNSQRPT